MGLLQDFKDLKWPGKTAVTVAALAGLAGLGYGANILRSKNLEEAVSVEETYKPGKTEDGKSTYTFKTNENQREGYTVSFKTETAFKRFNDFIVNYTADHEQQLEGRDYLTPSEAWQLVKLVDDKVYADSIREITDSEIDNAINAYHQKPKTFAIKIDAVAPKTPGKAFDLEAEANREYEKLETDQDRYLAMCRAKIGTRQERVHKLWNAAEASYQRDLRSNVSYQREKAEFRHYRR
jgi:hypothetical protein